MLTSAVPKVVIDLRMVFGRLHGISRYALELAQRLPRMAPDWQFVGLAGPQGLPEDLGSLRPPFPVLSSAADFLSPFEQPLLAGSLLKIRPDLFHATSFSLPAMWPGRLVATLHDANHLEMPENYRPLRVSYYRWIVGPRARFAKALITVSEFSRQALARHLSLNPYKFQVIHQGVDSRFAPPSTGDVAAFRNRHHLPARYFAAVGNAKPHKRLRVLAQIADALPAPIALLAGSGVAAQLGFPASSLELPALSEDEMSLYYGGAVALLLPSIYEGFGLPALEAMACGCPVIAADASAFPEVIGAAGLLVPADDLMAWKNAALRVYRDESLARSLASQGRERSARMSWDHCARQTLAVYKRALERG